ncbi:glutathione S-transferase family protein [Enterococcus dongliensis]|uniref:glutathione S-transferase family protein n=1 Tax=Enterococcus dongliensis TaxID=2559925 RepID=UPI0035D5E990
MATSEDIHEINKQGSFVRQKNRFITPFGDELGQLPVEAGRYRLLWARICPWAHRSIIVRELLGLQDVISVGTAAPIRTDKGWEFSLDKDKVDPVLKIQYLAEIYEATDPEYTGRATVPTVVDVLTGKVVNNDYFKLTNYLETSFKRFHKAGAPDLYPESLREDIDTFNDMLFHDVNNGVYKAGFAKSQAAYEAAYDRLFSRLDELEERLSHQRYLFGDKITDADVRFYVTLVRFDAAYYSVFKVNRNRIIDFPNIWNYAKDLYQTSGFGSTTDFESIKKGYQLGNLENNPYQLLTKGPDISIWNEPHDRNRFDEKVGK